jgi:hypothetical protein
MQRNFEPMRKQVETWQRSELTDVTAKVVIYEAFVEGRLEAPKHLARSVHDLYFEPKYEEFRPRTIWSLSNALYLCVQGTGSHPTVQGDSQAVFPGSSVLTNLLASGAVPADRPFPTGNSNWFQTTRAGGAPRGLKRRNPPCFHFSPLGELWPCLRRARCIGERERADYALLGPPCNRGVGRVRPSGWRRE